MSLVERITTLARRDRIATLGIALGAAWLFLVALFWLLAPSADQPEQGGVGRLAVIMATILPLALIWLAVRTARAIAVLRAEADDLRQSLAQMRQIAATRGAPPRIAPDAEATPLPDTPDQRLADPRQTDARASAARVAPRTADARQQAMRFDGPAPDPVDSDTLIRALNFPDGPEDRQAIAALRQALQDPEHARVLRAAQDVVTLLAAQDLYMDDLPPEPAPAGAWRQFAQGARGDTVAEVGGIHDGNALRIAAMLMQGDEIFRDTAHHFLRHFDAMLTRHLPQMDDAQIAVLTETRSARAFMLLGRISGTFG